MVKQINKFLSIFLVLCLIFSLLPLITTPKTSLAATGNSSGYKTIRIESEVQGYDFLVYYPDKYDIQESDVIVDGVNDEFGLPALTGITVNADLPGGWIKWKVTIYDKVYNKISLTYENEGHYADIEENGTTGTEAFEKPGHMKHKLVTGTGYRYNAAEWKYHFEPKAGENLFRYMNIDKIVIDIDDPVTTWYYYTAKLSNKKIETQSALSSATDVTTFSTKDRIHMNYGSTNGGRVYEDTLLGGNYDPPYDKYNNSVGTLYITREDYGDWNPNYKGHSSVDNIQPDDNFCLMATDNVGDFWVDASALGPGTYNMTMHYTIQYFPILKDLYKNLPDYNQDDMDNNRTYEYLERYQFEKTFRFKVDGKVEPYNPDDPTDPEQKLSQVLTVSAPTKAVSFKATKKKGKKKVLAKSKSFKIKASASTTVKYSVASYPKGMKKYISLSKKSGNSTKVTIKKGAAKGTYKIKVTAVASGSYAEAAPIYVSAKVK